MLNSKTIEDKIIYVIKSRLFFIEYFNIKIANIFLRLTKEKNSI